MRRVIILTVLILAAVTQIGAQNVAPGGTIPAVSTIPGVNGTFWRTDVTVLNLNFSDTSVVLLLLPEIKRGEYNFEPQISEPIIVPGGGQITLANVVEEQFELTDAKGGLSVFSTDGAPLVISARTYTNDEEGGTYGFNIYGVLVADTAWIAGVEEDGFYRTNIGIFMPVDPPGSGQSVVFSITVRDNAGTEVGSGSLLFDRAGLKQKNIGVFGVDTLIDGWIEIRCSDPSIIWYGYAAVVDEITGDAVYKPAVAYQGSVP